MSDQFVNPYTFVPVRNGQKRSYNSYWDGQLISGKISCRLKTRTQISICDYGSDERSHDFYSINGTPVIPGSSIRGVIRSVYEALTDSCFSSVNADDKDYFSSRMNKTTPGLLVREGGRYVLYRAERSKDDDADTQYEPWITDNLKTGDKVRFDRYKKSEKHGTIYYVDGVNNDDGNEYEGYVHRVDHFEQKGTHNFNSIFRKLDRVGTIDEAYIERFGVNLKCYEPKNVNCANDYKEAFERMKNKDGVYLPCWYAAENGHYYFAPSQMSRSIYYNKPIDLLAKQNLDRCISRENICEACALFGMVSGEESGEENSGVAVPARVRFGDADCVSKDPLEMNGQLFTLPILAAPRLSSFEFYLINKNSSYGADDKDTRISGRKFYWHNNKANITGNSENKPGNKMDSSVQLVKKGVEFTFDVYFDNITEPMLKKLLFAITLGDNTPDGAHCHKIGHGKPIGLGSVKIIAEKVHVRTFSGGIYTENVTDGSEITMDDLGSSLAFNKASILKVTDFNAVADGSMIHYPVTNTCNDIFKWFAENRSSFASGKPGYAQKLPCLRDTNQFLNKNAEKGGRDNQSSGRIGKTRNDHRKKW